MNKYLVMLAFTSGDMGVEFGLLPIGMKRLKYFKRLANLAKQLNKSDGVHSLQVIADNVDFYTSTGEMEIEFEATEQNPQILNLSSKQILFFDNVEEKTSCGVMTFTNESIKFSSFGKYTDTEYWCEVTYEKIFGWKAK